MDFCLDELLDASARHFPDRPAVEESLSSESLSYSGLARLSNRVRDRLARSGVRPHDRVGICLPKSADTVAALFGILKAGAAYVPVDPTAPASRNAYIFSNCGVKALIVDAGRAAEHAAEFEKLGFTAAIIPVEGTGGGRPLEQRLDQLDAEDSAPPVPSAPCDPSRLAYVLYTSGSTGRPKGVMLSHRNAACFVDWCSETFQPTEHDRFSSHAPFHFDLSVLDIYLSIRHGATLVIVEEGLGKEPLRLAPWIAEKRISIWYSAPSILSMMAQFGKLEQFDYSALRMVLFAGEVFPIRHLRLLKSLWRHPRYFNLYGPTETNVCTWYEVEQDIPESQAEPVPIGRACSHCRPLVVDPDQQPVPKGAEGELCIAGPSVLEGYWDLPEQTAKAFLTNESERWYRTGDIVSEQPDGNFRFLGRRDRMVKKRGYRIELGEIESALYRHPNVREAAVVALPDEQAGVRIVAWLSSRDGARLSTITLKLHCSSALPVYMVPDQFHCLESLPKTSTDKIDYQQLRDRAAGAGAAG